jgi:hypothetical protein
LLLAAAVGPYSTFRDLYHHRLRNAPWRSYQSVTGTAIKMCLNIPLRLGFYCPIVLESKCGHINGLACPRLVFLSSLSIFITEIMKRRSRRLLSCIVGSFLVVTGSTTSPAGLDDATVSQVRANLLQVASARCCLRSYYFNLFSLEAFISWELGTAAEALTELSWPGLSVFRSTAFPPPTQLNASLNASDVLQIASETVQNKPFDSMALVANDSAVGDPASEPTLLDLSSKLM